MHNLRAQRSHTGATANPNHLSLRVKYRMEIAIRTGHHNLIARFEAEDIGRCNSARYIHKARSLLLRFERRSGNTDRKGDDISLVRIVGHRVCPYGRLCILLLQAKETKFLPGRNIEVSNEAAVEVVVIQVVCRNIYLSIRTWKEVHMLSRRKRNLELLDE